MYFLNPRLDFQVRATDEDSGLFGQITYSFINDLGKTKFAIDASGVISTLEKLDRENPLNKDMVLTVMALDGGGTISFERELVVKPQTYHKVRQGKY